MKTLTNIVRSIWQWESNKTFVLFQMFILQSYAFSRVFYLVSEIRKNLDLRKILVTPKIFPKSRMHCTMSIRILNDLAYDLWLIWAASEFRSESLKDVSGTHEEFIKNSKWIPKPSAFFGRNYIYSSRISIGTICIQEFQ